MDEQEFAFKKGQSKTLPVTLTLEHVSPVTRLLEKRKQMLQVQDALDGQKEDYQRKEEIFKRREENLRKKDLELQEALVLFNKFLKENEQKRRRAEHRFTEESKRRQKWEKEIEIRRHTLAQLKSKCHQLKVECKKMQKYEEYLRQVYEEHGNHFDEINSIISRHATLKNNNDDLIKKQAVLLAKNEKLRSKFIQYKKDQYNKTLSLNNDIANYSRQLEEAAKDSDKILDQIMFDETGDATRHRQTTQIILAAENLYTRCKKMMKGGLSYTVQRLSQKEKEKMDPLEVVKLETCEKLEIAATYIEDLNQILESISGRTYKAARGKTAYSGSSSSEGR